MEFMVKTKNGTREEANTLLTSKQPTLTTPLVMLLTEYGYRMEFRGKESTGYITNFDNVFMNMIKYFVFSFN
jgi:hypothetical protein